MLRQHKGAFAVMLLLLLVLMACTTGEDKAFKEEQEAAQAAKAYYEQLAKGAYVAFIKGEVRSQHLPKSYQEQLVINLQKFADARAKDQARVDSITIAKASFLAKDSTARAYLVLHRADSTKEQIVVPLEKHKGKWLMR